MKHLRLIQTLCLCWMIGAAASAQAAAAQGEGTRPPTSAGAITSAVPRRQAPTPKLLPAPAEWRFEAMPLPPRFAPDIKWTGFEEIRFAPGVFDNSSPNYFSYVIALSVEGTPPIDAAGIQRFLEEYFGKPVPKGKKQYTFWMKFLDAKRSLQSGEINELVEKDIINAISDTIGGTLRK